MLFKKYKKSIFLKIKFTKKVSFKMQNPVNEQYIGITWKMCIEFVRRCLACQRAERAIIPNEITPIIATRPRKRLIVDAVSLL